MTKRRTGWFARIAPGILVAATGVGAGDLMTASLAGSKLGVTIVWAVILGAGMKWVMTEGLARWQMATGTTLLEGWTRKLHVHWIFLVYLVGWSFTVGGALISACGVAGHALLPLDGVGFLTPLSGDPETRSKIAWGIIHSLIGAVLVLRGGFKFFARFMSVCIGVMFVAVMYCAIRILPEIDAGALAFTNPLHLQGKELHWMLGLIGGVGGTVTLLSYGYWIREQKRSGSAGVRLCRIDLAVGYTMTAFFGIGMVIIASTIPDLEGKGARLALTLADRLDPILGTFGRYFFLVGFWGAVFSSLLGVWQSVPYLFADFLSQTRRGDASKRESLDYAGSWSYKIFLAYLAVPPMVLLWFDLDAVQLAYALLGAAFLPMLALTLLIMNTRRGWVPEGFRSRWITNALLVLTLAFFLWSGALTVADKLGWNADDRVPTQPAVDRRSEPGA